MEEQDDEVTVRYKFKGDKKVYEAKLTLSQYENIKQVPIVEFCKIVDEDETS